MIKRMCSLLLSIFLLVCVWAAMVGTPPSQAARLNLRPDEVTMVAQIFRNPIEERFWPVGTKVELNNSSVLAFRRYRDLYPLAYRKVIENAP